MPFLETIRAVYHYTRDGQHSYAANNQKLLFRLTEVFSRTYDLGFTAFGGPPVHFQIFHRRFVEGHGGYSPWIDEQTYHELFALCQALPGPASTKMLFIMVLVHAGLLPAIMAFLLWSLPGAIGMFGLALGVRQISDVLPLAVYALLSGLNAATVGVVALAAVQLAERAITDSLSRILVIFGACAGLCYTALWYFPVLIAVAGVVNVIWNLWLRSSLARLQRRWTQRSRPQHGQDSNPVEDAAADRSTIVGSRSSARGTDAGLQRRTTAVAGTSTSSPDENHQDRVQPSTTITSEVVTNVGVHGVSLVQGALIVGAFLVSFIALLAIRGTVNQPNRILSLFSNMYLAGTIIFGGGPVVIPLLRQYVVEPGWVTSRDFLIGLAIIQAFPGPNFNFAVYLGALSVLGTGFSPVLGAILGFAGIFTPGILLSMGIQGFWEKLRTKSIIITAIAGINAAAVGLVFTAVYRLWQIGYLSSKASQGQSLAGEPWWVVVTVVTYAECAWFKVPPAPAIIMGAVLGLTWYGVTGGQ